MKGAILGVKSEQSQIFNDNGERIPVSFIKTSPCYLINLKDMSTQGYVIIKLGFGETKKIKKSTFGEVKKAGIKTPLRFIKEFRVQKGDSLNAVENEGKMGLSLNETKVFVGEEFKPDIFFKKGDKVDISGTSKGKGFQGVVKRHKFAGGPRTHGQSDRERAPGSIGQTTTPGRVYKGKRMAGRMGGGRVTVKKLEIIEVKDTGILVKGLIPGSKAGLVEISLNA